MTFQPLGQLRSAVLDLYPRYQLIRENFLTGTDQKILSKRIDFLKEDKFALAVVGESKSGKSKFINALIGKELLPTDVLQCTSGIVEIIKKSKPSLRITYANETDAVTEYSNNSKANIEDLKSKLGTMAAIPDKYRNIPFIQINDFLIQKRGQNISTAEIESKFEDWNKVLPLTDEDKIIVADYIDEYKDMSRIPLYIQVGYPLAFDFENMSIVDTPGVNARGGIQNVTYEYIDDANAVVFIHTIKNIDSESLRNFFEKHLPKRNRSNIFLFLTHRGLHTSEEVEKVLSRAKVNFREIDPRKILSIDSMLKLVYNELVNGIPLPEITKDEEKFNLVARYQIRYKEDEEKIRESLLSDSNFETAFALLNEFSNQARRIQLEEITEVIFNDYTLYEQQIDEDVRLREGKLTKSPGDFEREIKEMQAMLLNYGNKLEKFSEEQRENYKGLNGEITIASRSLVKSYRNKIEQATDKSEVRKILIDFQTDAREYVEDFSAKLSEAYSNELSKTGAEIQAKNITPPHIDLSNIEDKAKEGAYETVAKPIYRIVEEAASEGAGVIGGAIKGLFSGFNSLWKGNSLKQIEQDVREGYESGYTEGRIVGKKIMKELVEYEYESVLSEVKFLNNLKSTAKAIVDTTGDQLAITLTDFFDAYDKEFKAQLKKLIDDRNRAYEELVSQKKSEDQIREEIIALKSQAKVISSELAALVSLKINMSLNS